MKNKVDVLIVDGSHLGYTNHCTQSGLITKSGLNTGAVFGTLRSLAAMISSFSPKRCIVLFDKGRNKARLNLYPEYKKKKEELDPIKKKQKEMDKESWKRQVDIMLDLFPLFGVYCIATKDQEADDAASILCNLCKESIVVASGDKDWVQLVNNRVSLYNYSKEAFVSENEWEDYIQKIEKLDSKIKRNSWILYRALCGDGSDNIPGISGIGPKTASVMCCDCENSDDLIKKLEKENHKKTEVVKNNKELLNVFMRIMDLSFSAKDNSLIESLLKNMRENIPTVDFDLAREKIIECEMMSLIKGYNIFTSKFKALTL
jgi:DNA polymerase-1